MDKFLLKDNAVGQIYSNMGVIVPVGDLEEGGAPAVGVLSQSIAQDSATITFTISSGTTITAMSYVLDEDEAVDVTPARSYTLELEDLDYNSSHTVTLSATNETGTTSKTVSFTMAPYTNWATADEILYGNRAYNEELGDYVVGTIETKTEDDITVVDDNLTIPAGYYAEEVERSLSITTEVLTATANGHYVPSTGYDAFSSADVAVTIDSLAWVGTQAQYDAIATKDPNTLYLIIAE